MRLMNELSLYSGQLMNSWNRWKMCCGEISPNSEKMFTFGKLFPGTNKSGLLRFTNTGNFSPFITGGGSGPELVFPLLRMIRAPQFSIHFLWTEINGKINYRIFYCNGSSWLLYFLFIEFFFDTKKKKINNLLEVGNNAMFSRWHHLLDEEW